MVQEALSTTPSWVGYGTEPDDTHRGGDHRTPDGESQRLETHHPRGLMAGIIILLVVTAILL